MTTVWSGLSVGSIYVLVAVAYNIVFLSTGVFNFAQAQFLMLGTFVAYTVAVKLHLNPLLAIPIGAVIGAAICVAEERIAIRPLQGRGAHGELVTTLGVAVLLDGVAVLIWGSDPLPVPFFASNEPMSFLTGRVVPAELYLIVIGCGVAIGAQLLTSRTLFGLYSLAAAEDRVAAALRGIDVRLLALASFALAGGFCVALGMFLAPKTYASFDLGDNLAIKGFVALAIGGYGSQKGALIGGLAVGMLEATSARYLGASFQTLTVFILLLAVLMLRPTGLFGERAQRTV